MTQQQTDRADRLVEDYLGAVSYACADLPADRRDDLVADLREHISAARAVLYQPTEAAIRTILDRLGEPTAIAEEALLGEPGPVAARASDPRPEPATGNAPTATILGMVFGFVLIVIALLFVGAVLAGLG